MEILLILIPGILILIENWQKQKRKNERMVKITHIIDLENLKSKVEKMDLPRYTRERLVEEIDSHIRMITHDLIEELGKKVFNEMLEKQRDAK